MQHNTFSSSGKDIQHVSDLITKYLCSISSWNDFFNVGCNNCMLWILSKCKLRLLSTNSIVRMIDKCLWLQKLKSWDICNSSKYLIQYLQVNLILCVITIDLLYHKRFCTSGGVSNVGLMVLVDTLSYTNKNFIESKWILVNPSHKTAV